MTETVPSRSARNRRQQPKKKLKPKKGLIKRLFLIAFMAGFFLLVGGAILFAVYAKSAPDLDEELLRDPLSSEYLDINGDVFYKSGTEKREFIPYNDIPKKMEEAILATEDVRFYQHHGMDFYRLGGAVLANFRSGFGSQGASTLTQQVIKNSFLSDEKTLKRKAQEAWLAFQLERSYDKEEIFEMYFNKILMSGNTYGFGTAAHNFYGKDLKDLELHEMAMLAGLPQSPNGYNPIKNPDRAEKRRNIVLKLMHQHGKITENEMKSAQAIPVTSTLLSEEERLKQTDNTKYAAFVDLVHDELEKADLADVLAEGVTIQTTLDPQAQIATEKALQSDIYRNDRLEAAISVIDSQTGGIVAVGGGRNYKTGFLNFATEEKRQPGSIIKPILDYGPAIEHLSWSTGQTVHDDPYKYKGTNITVRNVDHRYLGALTMREAVIWSRNVPAIKAYEKVGREKSNEFARSIGINLTNDFPSNAIGGTEDEFSTVEMAGAYQAFANNGVYIQPHAVKKITYRDGITEKNLTPKPVNAMKDSTAYMMTDMLRDVMTTGTGKRANLSNLDVAGKTGTTNDAIDSWFAGYTTNYTIAAWSGYQDRTGMKDQEGERTVPQDLFKQVMREVSSSKETSRFKKPSSVTEATIIKGSEPLALATSSTPENLRRTELFVKGTMATPSEEKEVTLNSPSDVSASYDAENNAIQLSWTHASPDPNELPGDVSFTVSYAIEGGSTQTLTTTGGMTASLSGVETGKTYKFSVVASVGKTTSGAAGTSITIPGGEIEEEPEEEPEETTPEEPEQPIVPEENNSTGNGSTTGGTGNGSTNNGGGTGGGSNSNNNGSGKPPIDPEQKPTTPPTKPNETPPTKPETQPAKPEATRPSEEVE